MMTSFQTFLDSLEPGVLGEEKGALLTAAAARKLWDATARGADVIDDKALSTLSCTIRSDISRCIALQALLRRSQRPKNVLAPFNPTPASTVEIACDLLEIESNDIVYDIGCGDGRIVAAAARRGAKRCVGIELDNQLASRARRAVADWPNATILNADARSVDISEATKVFLYLVPSGIQAMKATLGHLLHYNRARIVAYTFTIPGFQIAKTERTVSRSSELLADHGGDSCRSGTPIADHPPLYLYMPQPALGEGRDT